MTCQQIQSHLSLYLYGELDFAIEETVEEHLLDCAFCQQALAREKSWHAVVNSEQNSVPLDLLAACRNDLEKTIRQSPPAADFPSRLQRWWNGFYVISSAWPARVSAAALLLAMGFGIGRWVDQRGFAPGLQSLSPPVSEASVAPYMRVRDIQPGVDGRVHLIVDHIDERVLSGSASDQNVRAALLSAAADPSDPALRVDSLDYLRGQTGNDVRDALLKCVREDRNAAVRLKAVEGLRSFGKDPATRHALVDVLSHDANAGIRAAAIDVLLPPKTPIDVSPELLQLLQQASIGVSSAGSPDTSYDNDYVQTRYRQALQTMQASSSAQVY